MEMVYIVHENSGIFSLIKCTGYHQLEHANIKLCSKKSSGF